MVNRAALMPTRAQLDRSTDLVEEARARLTGTLVIDYVVPDYYARRPKKCMDGWGRHFFNVNPAGKVLPCHAAESIEGMMFDTVRENSLGWIWANSAAFKRFCGTGWMLEPCRSCDRREIDFGGCQAFALTGDAGNTDPACELSPHHAMMFEAALADSSSGEADYNYRRIGASALVGWIEHTNSFWYVRAYSRRYGTLCELTIPCSMKKRRFVSTPPLRPAHLRLDPEFRAHPLQH